MAQERVKLLTPVGRMVWGNLYEPRTKDAEGNALTVKSGPNAGQPRVDYSFGIAIPKQGEQHWSQTPWGALIWNAGHAAFPQGQGNAPTFAWKVTDGDSAVPNRKGRAPNTQEGYPGHWVISFSSGLLPRLVNRDGSQSLTEAGAIKAGYYIQVYGNVVGNGSSQQPGVFMSAEIVSMQAFGEEIRTGTDAATVGFGGGALPAGASMTPPAGMVQPPATPAAPTAQAPVYQQPAAPVPVQQVTPNHAFANPAPPVVPSAPAAPTAPAPRQMTASAGGIPYESWVASGWSDAQLIQAGHMLP